MKRILGSMLVLVFAATCVGAATVETTKGTNNIVFQFNGLSTLGVSGYDFGMGGQQIISTLEDQGENPFSGLSGANAGIGWRHYISDGTALRPGVTFGYASGEVKDPANSSNKTTSTVQQMGVNLVLEKHRNMKGPISPYLGAGAGYDYTKFKVEQKAEGQPTDKVELAASAFSIFGVLGFEWAFADAVTLGGEYRAGFSAASGNVKTDGEKTADVSATAGGIGTASLFLSVGW
jgi:hypothetical protein